MQKVIESMQCYEDSSTVLSERFYMNARKENIGKRNVGRLYMVLLPCVFGEAPPEAYFLAAAPFSSVG